MRRQWWLVNYDTDEVLAGPFWTALGTDRVRSRMLVRLLPRQMRRWAKVVRSEPVYKGSLYG